MNKNPKAILEGILFAIGNSVPIKRLSEVMEMTEKQVTELLESMAEEYESDERGIRLIRLEDSYQLCTKREYYDYIHLLKEKNRRSALTNAGLEVLSVVAYNQPVTRGTIEFIRGVNSDGPLNNLIASGLVEEVGRLDAPGRPILFGTTEEFLRCFNLSSISELPQIEGQYSFDGLKQEENIIQEDSAEENTAEKDQSNAEADVQNTQNGGEETLSPNE